MVKIDYYDAALMTAVVATFYFYFKSQYYRMRALRRKATKSTTAHKERTAAEKSSFMAESKSSWGVIE